MVFCCFSTSVYYTGTECKPMNKNGGSLGMRLTHTHTYFTGENFPGTCMSPELHVLSEKSDVLYLKHIMHTRKCRTLWGRA